jgi:hypothetical protein
MQITNLVADKYVRITFAGSFQARLATNGADQKDSPTEWVDSSPDRTGWTFSYNELRLDRVIRLSNPLQLRSALVDPWRDAKVTKVEVSASALGLVGGYWGPMMEFKGDPLIGQVVSLGEAKFNSRDGGGGMGYEVLDDFAFSVGGTQFLAKQAQKTRLTGVKDLPKEWVAHYRQTKAAAVAGALAGMPPARQKLLTTFSSGEEKKPGAIPRFIGTYSYFYATYGEMPDIPLNQVQILANVGVLGAAKQVADQHTWRLSLTFSRFDGDTLTGQIDGVLEGRDSKLDLGRR